MKHPKLKPGTLVQQGEDLFCVLMIDEGELWMHRIRPEPQGFYSRRMRLENLAKHGYKVVTRFKGRG